jgi:ArsR family transcriptional regulator, cadmium/lead-responsive transcriptional repressor
MSERSLRQASRDDVEEQRLEITTKFFRGLTDPTRLRIIELLLDEGEQNVSELVERLGQPQARVSSHLACLRWCGYVNSRREGKYVYYRVADERVAALLEIARGMIVEHATAILTCTRM